jgi:hypothetical protein
MVGIEAFRSLALSLPGAIEAPHFEKTSFRVQNRIFATLDLKSKLACLMLTDLDQSVFCAWDRTSVYPVPNKWGQKGATYFDLKRTPKALVKDALHQAYRKITEKNK